MQFAPDGSLSRLQTVLGWISKVCVINIDILCDDRFDPSADTISCLALLNPDWSEHFVNVTGLDLRDGEFFRWSGKRTV
jgi:hypothetical protein